MWELKQICQMKTQNIYPVLLGRPSNICPIKSKWEIQLNIHCQLYVYFLHPRHEILCIVLVHPWSLQALPSLLLDTNALWKERLKYMKFSCWGNCPFFKMFKTVLYWTTSPWVEIKAMIFHVACFSIFDCYNQNQSNLAELGLFCSSKMSFYLQLAYHLIISLPNMVS